MAERKEHTSKLRCFHSSCASAFSAQDDLATHIQAKHNNGKLINCHIALFPPDVGGIPPAALATSKGNSEVQTTEDEDTSGLASPAPLSEEGSGSEVISEGGLGPSRGRPQRPHIYITFF